jgi:hypothetical protein
MSAGFTAEQHAKACSLGLPKWYQNHAAPPGSGPEGATCGSCTHLSAPTFVRPGLHTCGLVPMRREIDPVIRASTPACVRYVAEGDRP